MATLRSLLDLTTQQVCDNIEYYKRDVSRMNLARLNLVRAKMIEYFLREEYGCRTGQDCPRAHSFDKRWAAMICLFNSPKYKKFDINDVTPRHICRNSFLSNSLFQEFIRCMSSNTPNLEELIISNRLSWNLSLGKKEAESITRLMSLTVLNIFNVPIAISDFLRILGRCKSLRDVNAGMIILDEEPSISSISESFVNQKIYAVNLFKGWMQWELSTTTRLDKGREVRLDLAPSSNAKLNLLRNLTHTTSITIDCRYIVDEQALEVFPYFPNVTQAEILCSASANALGRFLVRNGKYLEHLVITSLAAGKLSFEQLFELSPNLLSLTLYDSTLHWSSNNRCSSRLERIVWYGTHNKNDVVPLARLIETPSIKKINIHAKNIDMFVGI